MRPVANPFSPPFWDDLPPLARRVVRPLLEIDTAAFSEAEQERFSGALFELVRTIAEILRDFHEGQRQPQIDAAYKTATKYLVSAPDRRVERLDRRAELPRLKEAKLISQIALACLSFAEASLVTPAARERVQAALERLRAARGRAGRSAKSEVLRKVVYECIDDHLRIDPNCPRKRYTITKAIQGTVKARLDKLPEKERPKLKIPSKGRNTVSTAVRNYVEEYLAELNKFA